MPKKLTKHALNIKQEHLMVLGGLVAILALVNLVALTIAIKYDGSTFPGLMVANTLMGGLGRNEVAKRVSVKEEQFVAGKLSIVVKGTTVEVDPSSFVNYDPEKTAAKALGFGREGNIFEVWNERARAIARQEDLTVSYQINETQLGSVIDDVARKVESTGSDARIEVKNGKAVVTPEKVGVRIDKSRLRNEMLIRVGKLENEPIKLEVQITNPKVTAQDLETAKEETDNALKSAVTLTWSGRNWTITPEQVFSLLSYSTHEDSVVTANVGGKDLGVGKVRKLNSKSEPTGNLEPQLILDFSKLGAILDPIATVINKPATDPKLAFVNGKLQVAGGSGEGKEVDQQLLVSKVKAALNGQGSKTVEIPVKVSQSGIDIAHLESLGIKELIGKGQSFYSGSIPGRNRNIAVAAGKVNGALVAPGQVFSLYKQIGEVTPQAGYVTSYVIVGHRTELGIGGGVCQVSTTLFRAALATGLPIVERHPHSYRVHYYEQNSGPGMDATVYFPNVDFRFRNDTGHWVLIQTVNDPAHASLTFEFYGTSDGRQVALSTPVVTNVRSAPAPLYQYDPNLAKGVTKQVDWAVEGADASFSRKVTRNGEVIINDTYYSKYSPWQAVYMVGTRG